MMTSATEFWAIPTETVVEELRTGRQGLSGAEAVVVRAGVETEFGQVSRRLRLKPSSSTASGGSAI